MAVFLMESKRNGKNGNGAVYQVTQIKGTSKGRVIKEWQGTLKKGNGSMVIARGVM